MRALADGGLTGLNAPIDVGGLGHGLVGLVAVTEAPLAPSSTSSALQNAWLYRAADEANRSKDELIRRVRTVLRVSPERLPAIALTALSDVRSRIELLGAGFQRSLRKPVDASELTRTVADVARQRQKSE